MGVLVLKECLPTTLNYFAIETLDDVIPTLTYDLGKEKDDILQRCVLCGSGNGHRNSDITFTKSSTLAHGGPRSSRIHMSKSQWQDPDRRPGSH